MLTPNQAIALERVRAGDILVFVDGDTFVSKFDVRQDSVPHCVALNDAEEGETVDLVYSGWLRVNENDVHLD